MRRNRSSIRTFGFTFSSLDYNPDPSLTVTDTSTSDSTVVAPNRLVSRDPERMGALFMSIVPGYILQLALLGPEAVDGAADAIRTLWSGAATLSPG